MSDMKIDRIDLWHVSVPLPAPFCPSWIPGMAMADNHFDLLRLTTAGGLEGWAAAPAMGHERSGMGALLGSYVLGERADDVPSIRQRIREMSYLGWRCSWMEAALWDILGKAAGKPVWRLLSGESGPAPRLQLYASSGVCRPPAEAAEMAAARVAEGFGAVKLRVHAPTLAEDVAVLQAVRARVGDGVRLMVDANQGWRVAVVADAPRWDLDRATAFCVEAARLGFDWVEEPLPFDAYEAQVELRRRLREAGAAVSVAGGELNNQTVAEFRLMLDKGCLDLYQPDAVFNGGVSGTWEIIRAVAAAGGRYSPHTWTNGFGFALNTQLFAASPFREGVRLEYPLDPPGWVPEGRDGVLQRPFLHERGSLVLPETPGLGAEVDPAALSRHGARFYTATRARVAVRAVLERGVAAARALGATRDARIAARSAALDQHFGGKGDAVSLALGELV